MKRTLLIPVLFVAGVAVGSLLTAPARAQVPAEPVCAAVSLKTKHPPTAIAATIKEQRSAGRTTTTVDWETGGDALVCSW